MGNRRLSQLYRAWAFGELSSWEILVELRALHADMFLQFLRLLSSDFFSGWRGQVTAKLTRQLAPGLLSVRAITSILTRFYGTKHNALHQTRRKILPKHSSLCRCDAHWMLIISLRPFVWLLLLLPSGSLLQLEIIKFDLRAFTWCVQHDMMN